MAFGYAVIDKDGQIDMKTVSHSQRAAIVNWLVARQGVYVTTEWDDDNIYRVWFEVCGPNRVVEVAVERAE